MVDSEDYEQEIMVTVIIGVWALVTWIVLIFPFRNAVWYEKHWWVLWFGALVLFNTAWVLSVGEVGFAAGEGT